jgi:hypothetical protein
MKSLMAAFLLLSGGMVFAQEQVVFSAPTLHVGQSFEREANYKMNFDVVLKFAGETLQEANRASTQTTRKSETILGMNGDAITKLKVKYDVLDEKMVVTEDGIAQDQKIEPNPVLKQTYIVSIQNGVVKVTDENGLKPDINEINIVSNDYANLGKADSFRQFFRSRTVQVGEPLQMPGVLAEGMFTDASHRKIKVENASFILRKVQNKVAVFDSALKMQWNQDANTSLKLNLTGETLVDIQTSHLVSSSLSGTMRITGTEQFDNRLAMLDGKGKITVTESLKQK